MKWGPGLVVLVATSTLGAAARPAEAETLNVRIAGFAFDPAAAPVRMADGEPGLPGVHARVTWTMADPGTTHTVTFDDKRLQSSAQLATGDRFEQVFTQAGTFTYRCMIHPSMTGSVVVTAPPATTMTAPLTTLAALPAATLPPGAQVAPPAPATHTPSTGPPSTPGLQSPAATTPPPSSAPPSSATTSPAALDAPTTSVAPATFAAGPLSIEAAAPVVAPASSPKAGDRSGRTLPLLIGLLALAAAGLLWGVLRRRRLAVTARAI